MDRHIRILARIFIVGGAVSGILGLLLLVFLGEVSDLLLQMVSRRFAMSIPLTSIYLMIIGWVAVLASIPAVISGFGLIRYHEWARFLAIVVSLVNVINFPLGSILGTYGLWVLLSPETEYLFLEPPPEHRARAH